MIIWLSTPLDIPVITNPDRPEYPMLFEARDFDMDTHAMELNLFLDAMLEVTYKHAGRRPLWFSSFSPELCILLSTKQRLYPVLFLTESGNIPTRDIRAISYQEAIRFAKKWNLEGVVPAAEPLVASPMLVDQARDSGLICATWGSLNDDADCVKVWDSHVHVSSLDHVRRCLIYRV